MPIISDIAIRISAVTAPFTNGLKKASMIAKKFTASLSRGFGSIMGGFKSLTASLFRMFNPLKLLSGAWVKIGAILTAVAGGGMLLMIKSQFELIDAVVKTSRAIGVNIEFLEGLKLAGSQLGVGNEKIIKSLKKFTRTMGEAKLETGAGATVFRIWGKNIKDFQNLNVEDSFKAISAELRKIKDPTKQAAIAFQFFGRNGIEMLNIINANKGSLEDFIQESTRLKGIFGKLDTDNVEQANDAFDKMKITLSSIFKELTFILAPFVKLFSDTMQSIFINLRKRLEGLRQGLRSGIVNVIIKIAKVAIAMSMVFEAVFSGFLKFFNFDGPNAVNVMMKSIMRVTGTLAFFIKKIGDAKGTIAGDVKDIGQIIFMGFNNVFKLTFGNAIAILGFVITEIKDNFVRLFKILTINFENAFIIITKLIKAGKLLAKGKFTEGLEEVGGIGDAVAKNIKDAVGGAIKDVGDNFSKMIDNLTGFDKLSKDFDDFVKSTQKKKGGGIFELIDFLTGRKNIQLKAFLTGFEKQVDMKAENVRKRIAAFFEGLKLDDVKDEITDFGDFEDVKKQVILELDPKLAKKGSQEAARLASESDSLQEKIVEATVETAKNTANMSNKLSNFIDMQLGISDLGAPPVDPFSPALIQALGR